jgi:hypothetical protein
LISTILNSFERFLSCSEFGDDYFHGGSWGPADGTLAHANRVLESASRTVIDGRGLLFRFFDWLFDSNSFLFFLFSLFLVCVFILKFYCLGWEISMHVIKAIE